MRTTPASSRHRAPAERKFTQCKYTAPAVRADHPFDFSRIPDPAHRKGFCDLHVRFSEEVFGSANRFVSEQDHKTSVPAHRSRDKLIEAIYGRTTTKRRPFRRPHSKSLIDGGQFRRSISGHVIGANTETWDRNGGSADRYRLLGHTNGADSDERRAVVARRSEQRQRRLDADGLGPEFGEGGH